MSREENGFGKKVLAGALLAGALGYVAGVLTAPKSGKETRKDVRKAAGTVMRDAEKQLKQLHTELTDMINKAQVKADRARGTGKTEATKLMDVAADARERVRHVLSNIHEGDASDPDLKAAIKSARDAVRALGNFLKK
jgi:gas vesicle protein